MGKAFFKNKISLSFLILNICFQKYLFKRHNAKIKLSIENTKCKKDLYSLKMFVGKGGNGGRRQLNEQGQWL
jgi:hypothetical protein